MNLPVNEVREKLIDAVFSSGRLLLRAPTGSGKSTCVPPMLLDACNVGGLIVVVQPRRIAARMLARCLSQMRGSQVGEEVGYVVRFENCMSSHTKIVYVTDGVLQRWLQDDAELLDVGAVIFDEFHERRVASDVALARCLDLQEKARKDLKVVIMSATLEVEGLKNYLQPCEVLEAEGRAYPVDVFYAKGLQPKGRNVRQDEKVWDKAAGEVKAQISNPDAGHILVFLPGVYEIKRTVELIERASWSRGWEVCPLYSGLSPTLQDAAVSLGEKPRIIVSTNVAETSITIDGVRTVIDAGLARVSRYDAGRGMDTLLLEKISRASADQRAGRAGRIAPGRCIRLWSEADQGRRNSFEIPEIMRVDMADVVLSLKVAGVERVADFRWLDKPSEASLAHAHRFLLELGALDTSENITEHGALMGALPLHPRYACLVLLGSRYGCLAEAAFIASVMQGEGVFMRGRDSSARVDFSEEDDSSDFAAEWRAFQVARDMKYDPRRCGQYGILARGARDTGKALEQIRKSLRRMGEVNFTGLDFNQKSIRLALLGAFSDRVSMRLNQGTLACRVVGGRGGKLDAQSVVKLNSVFLAAEVTEVGGKDVAVYLNRCSAIESDDLKEAFPYDFSQKKGAVYDATSRRVVARNEMYFRDLVLDSKEGSEPPLDQCAQLLSERVMSGELKLNRWDQSVERWVARLVSLTNWMPEMELPGFSEDDKAMVIEELCQGAKSYKEIKNRDVMPILDKWLSEGQKQVLLAYAPLEVTLSNGRKAKVRYCLDGVPSISMKMQFLYDVNELPEIAQGRVKLRVNILAPNQRPWQVTDDLAGFWERGYLQMKKDLAGRYPKHEWR